MSKQHGSSHDMVRLSSGIYVPRSFHDELFEHVAARITELKYAKRYKAKDMVNPTYYALHDPWQIGYCVAHWERERQLAVRFLGCPYCSVKYYARG